MKIFLDSADLDEITALSDTGFVDGVTTNPSLIAKSGHNILDRIAEICAIIDGPVSAEVTATDYDKMLAEGRKLAAIAPNVAVKVPLTRAGLQTCRTLSDEGTRVNVTLCFTAGQALLAAKAGAAFISPFVGRLDDIGRDGMGLIEEICTLYANYDYHTKIISASTLTTNEKDFLEELLQSDDLQSIKTASERLADKTVFPPAEEADSSTSNDDDHQKQ